ncbi:beta/gamma crystallin-related protein [Duganella sp. HH101]|uniref:beta/gamma crystallin-related protein n=1 Tax=Duganella sp. HH101 TaxID=1781066 RepID=UPI000873E6EE|nr:beta/gamma crystallin-related protein [Duganella sp. HH101]OFA03178.1 beta/gamma crystallin [Duganella sp. HH101]
MKRILGLALLGAAAAAQAGDITLYTRAHFGGPALQLHGSEPDLDKLGFNDRTSSVIVQNGTWEVCENKHYKGKCLILEKGEYAELKNFNDMMSSVREIEARPAAKDKPEHK